MKQRTDEWVNVSQKDYHTRQLEAPYRSTVKFCDWMDGLRLIRQEPSLEILDVGAGSGANLHYLSDRYPGHGLLGAELNGDLVSDANARFQELDLKCQIEQADLYNFSKDYVDRFDGIVCLQTLSWLPGYEEAIDSMLSLRPQWIALSSLFFDGELNCTVKVEDGQNDRECFYNIYSLSSLQDHCKSRGYGTLTWEPFVIDVDLPISNPRGLGTYTKELVSGNRLQFSGPLSMPWYFVCIRPS
ncbi:class I SAM-dependent methyltransferase [bacterium]|jgi:SAM-dependent methyltransferase|nr:class I SAM-dependent methyltransferase [Verrucomicrobiales bacterium]MDC0503240.1 class I SAM-dependent methyltransferase [Verrucomicrobiales bacterium]MDC3255202.1 class I SAM-dependent methyltransferase [bacterium]MDF1789888.1 class I SAM-dependent methyltransferase [Verrucomicrobiales bacterium]